MILYLTYDGLTDPLGQSQILPYLMGLGKHGHEIHIISFEKKDRFKKEKSVIQTLIDSQEKMTWHPLNYHLHPKLFSTAYDLNALKVKAKKIILKHNIRIVHCRSYPTSIIGSYLKRKLDVKFIFDMRGFYIDERFDGGIWNKDNIIWKLFYPRLKKLELRLINNADMVVSLTKNGQEEMVTWQGNLQKNYTIIPCAADLDHFNLPYKKESNQLNIVYLGSLGTWYLLNEMLDFFKQLSTTKPDCIFHFITKDNPDMILKMAEQRSISKKHLKIYPSSRQELPRLLQYMDLAIFFIKPSFSKKASSPTKLGELLGMGIPVICNGNVGDIDIQSSDNSEYLITTELNEASYNQVINEIPRLLEKRKNESNEIRLVAKKYFSLNDGIDKYDAIYQQLLND